MKKPTKKQGIAIAVIIVLLGSAGGWALMDQGKENNIPKASAVVVDNVKPVIEKAIADQKQEEKEKQEKEKQENGKKEKEKQQETAQKEVEQTIAPEPEIPPEETVQAPPVQQQMPAVTEGSGSGDSENHEGMVWIDGFGWIKDEGGGSEGEYADDMIPNGNQIGEMN